jgi:FtsP/CotA-like multicopper oxidase with cupredoxin domain
MRRRDFLALASAAAGHAATAHALQRPRAVAAAAPFNAASPTLRIQPVTLELGKNAVVKTIGYNGKAPGPILRFKEGVPTTIDVYNETKNEELVHWHGLAIDTINDGAVEEGSPVIAPGGHQRYNFTPKPTGTRWYHTHTMAMDNLSLATYTGQFGFLYIEPRHEPGDYDQEIFLAIHHWEPHLMMMDAPMNAKDVAYKYASFNDKLHSAAEPIRVKQGQRIMFRLLNASATQTVALALPGHQFTVMALDGNPVPQPYPVETVVLGVAERIDAIVEMNTPGVWVMGSTNNEERNAGLGRTIEYAGSKGDPIWAAPDSVTWDYFLFANTAKAPEPDFKIPMTFSPLPAGPDGMQHWTVNGKEFPHSEPLHFHAGKRHRLVFVNGSAELHPLHLHRHSFELVSLGGRTCSGLMKDTVNIPPNSTMEVDVIADNPGDTLFHCHQQLHMDYGFMQLFKYV